MAVTMGKKNARFEFVTAGHHFLLRVLPFRQPESRHALATFVAEAKRINSSRLDVDLVLLRCVAVLSNYAVRRIPSLLEQYLVGRYSVPDDLTRFSRCVEGLLRYHAISDGSVQEAIQLISTRFGDVSSTPKLIAATLGQRLSTLDVAFKNQMGCTLTECIRDVRLSQAAMLLATSNKSIKEVWAEVGYAHHSNFDHDFKRKFLCTPREYRTRAVRPIAQEVYGTARRTSAWRLAQTNASAFGGSTSVLIVDDDEGSRTSLRELLCSEGYSASVAASGSEGLREAERISPNVILLDYRLGDMDGLEFLRILRQRPGGGLPNVSLFTADCEVIERADEVNALNAIVATKLCVFDQIKDLVDYLSGPRVPTGSDHSERQASDPWWTRWIA